MTFGSPDDFLAHVLKTFRPYLNTFVLVGGFAARAIVSHFASRSAERAAIEGIKDGRIRFEPYAAADRLGLRATWRR